MSEPQTITDIRVELAAAYCRIIAKDPQFAQAIALAALDVLTLPISELEPETAAAFDGAFPVGWQDISTAPKDGTVILAWCVHPNARFAGDSKEWCCPVVTQWISHNGGGWTWHGMVGDFTHWHRLPAPPAKNSTSSRAEGAAGNPARDAQSTPPPIEGEARERVARIIDPDAFEADPEIFATRRWGSASPGRTASAVALLGRLSAAALAKADAILALFATPSGHVLVPPEEVDGLVEALTHAISICPSLDTNGYITEKSEAIKAVKAALRGRGEGGAGEGQGAAGQPSGGGER